MVVTSPRVQMLPASVRDRPAIAAFLRAYLSEFGFRERYPYFEQYWTEAERFPFVISCNGEPAGFAFVRSVDQANEVAEFYVLPQYRGSGVGRAAAEALFSAFPGAWRVPVQDSNADGLKFWARVLPSSAISSIEGSSLVHFCCVARESRDVV